MASFDEDPRALGCKTCRSGKAAAASNPFSLSRTIAAVWELVVELVGVLSVLIAPSDSQNDATALASITVGVLGFGLDLRLLTRFCGCFGLVLVVIEGPGASAVPDDGFASGGF